MKERHKNTQQYYLAQSFYIYTGNSYIHIAATKLGDRWQCTIRKIRIYETVIFRNLQAGNFWLCAWIYGYECPTSPLILPFRPGSNLHLSYYISSISLFTSSILNLHLLLYHTRIVWAILYKSRTIFGYCAFGKNTTNSFLLQTRLKQNQ